MPPFHVSHETADTRVHVSSTPPLLCHDTAPLVDLKTARKPIELQPTTIRLNRVTVNTWEFKIRTLFNFLLLTRDCEDMINQKLTELFWTLDHLTLYQVELIVENIL